MPTISRKSEDVPEIAETFLGRIVALRQLQLGVKISTGIERFGTLQAKIPILWLFVTKYVRQSTTRFPADSVHGGL
jgi:hypothetical protein